MDSLSNSYAETDSPSDCNGPQYSSQSSTQLHDHSQQHLEQAHFGNPIAVHQQHSRTYPSLQSLPSASTHSLYSEPYIVQPQSPLNSHSQLIEQALLISDSSPLSTDQSLVDQSMSTRQDSADSSQHCSIPDTQHSHPPLSVSDNGISDSTLDSLYDALSLAKEQLISVLMPHEADVATPLLQQLTESCLACVTSNSSHSLSRTRDLLHRITSYFNDEMQSLYSLDVADLRMQICNRLLEMSTFFGKEVAALSVSCDDVTATLDTPLDLDSNDLNPISISSDATVNSHTECKDESAVLFSNVEMSVDPPAVSDTTSIHEANPTGRVMALDLLCSQSEGSTDTLIPFMVTAASQSNIEENTPFLATTESFTNDKPHEIISQECLKSAAPLEGISEVAICHIVEKHDTELYEIDPPCEEDIDPSQAYSDQPSELENGVEYDHRKASGLGFDCISIAESITEDTPRYWGEALHTPSHTGMYHQYDQESIIASQEFASRMDHDHPSSLSPTCTPVFSQNDAVSSALHTILESTTMVSTVYQQMKSSWVADRADFEKKLQESARHLQESNKSVSMLKNQLVTLGENSENAILKTSLLQQQTFQAQLNDLAGSFNPLKEECALLKQSVISTQESVVLYIKTLLDDTKDVLMGYQEKATSLEAGMKEQFDIKMTSLSESLSERQSELSKALQELTMVSAERDLALEKFSGIRCSLSFIQDRFMKQKAALNMTNDAHVANYLKLEATMESLNLEYQSSKSHCAELELQIKNMSEAMVRVEQHDNQLSCTQSILNSSLAMAEQDLHETRLILKKREADLNQAHIDLQEFAECTKNASDLWEMKQAEYVARINKLCLEAKTFQETADGMQLKYSQVTEQLQTAILDLNKSLESVCDSNSTIDQLRVELSLSNTHLETLKQRELLHEEEIQAKDVAIENTKLELQKVMQQEASRIEDDSLKMTDLSSQLAQALEVCDGFRADLLISKKSIESIDERMLEMHTRCSELELEKNTAESSYETLLSKYQAVMTQDEIHSSTILKLREEIDQIGREQTELMEALTKSKNDLHAQQTDAEEAARIHSDLVREMDASREIELKLRDQIVELQEREANLLNAQELQGKSHMDQIAHLEQQHLAAIEVFNSSTADHTQSFAQLESNLANVEQERSLLRDQLQLLTRTSEYEASIQKCHMEELYDTLAKQLAEITLISAQYDLICDTLMEASSSNISLQTTIDMKTHETVNLLESKTLLKVQVEEYRVEIDRLQQSLIGLGAEIEVNTSEKADLANKVDVAQTSLENLLSAMHNKDAELDATHDAILKWQSRYNAVDAELTMARTSLGEESDIGVRLKAAMESLSSDLSATKAKCSEMKIQLEDSEARNAQVQSSLHIANEALIEAERKRVGEADEHSKAYVELQAKLRADFKVQMTQLMVQNKEAVSANIDLRKQVDYLHKKVGHLQACELQNTIARNSSVIQATQGSISSEYTLAGGASDVLNTTTLLSDAGSSQSNKVKKRAVDYQKPDVTPAIKRVRGDLRGAMGLRELPGGAMNCTPGSVRRTREANVSILISISGFKDIPPFNSALRERISKSAKALPDACFLGGSTVAYDPRITHVISPKGTRTLKIFAASLMGAWLITNPDWIMDSVAHGAWLPEGKYGHRSQLNPYLGKRFFLAPSFQADPKFKDSRQEQLACLVTMCSKGTFVDTVDDADIVMRTDADDSTYPVKALTWTNFISLIPYSQEQ
ncbi:hypothetical protein BASA61_008648 [Batrachochytrium salamandrivorans]|nr:hypothetical protein BASA61_008648 [Batrachochytrium salamandrivorans]